MGSFANLTIIDHPLIQHKVGHLRRKTTPTKLFKELVNEISTLMAFEVTRGLPLEDVVVETPLEETVARRIQGKKLVVVPILRAGLGMVEGILHLIPGARVGHIGLFRDEDTLRPVEYYVKLPPVAGRAFIVVDPMLAWSRLRKALRPCSKRIPTCRCMPRRWTANSTTAATSCPVWATPGIVSSARAEGKAGTGAPGG